MAKIKQGILGGFSGKVANVVGTSWKGRAVMKSQPLSVANPRTALQTEQRGKFSEIANSILTTFIHPVENPISGNVSGYNKFVKDNKQAFDALGKLVQEYFGCGGGKLPFVDSAEAIYDSSMNQLSISWTNPANISPLRLTDKVYAVAFKDDGELAFVSSGVKTREDEVVDINPIDAGLVVGESDVYYALLALVSEDGRDVSVFQNCLSVTIS